MEHQLIASLNRSFSGASLSHAFSSQEITPIAKHLEMDGRMRRANNGNSLGETSKQLGALRQWKYE
jgi:hypothetical protein